MSIQVGDKFPEFEVITHKGEKLTRSNLEGKSFVLFSYPRAMTSGCTKEVCSIRDYFTEIKNRGVVPFGISNDSPDKNRKFAEKHNLQYDLISDEDSKLLRELGSYGEKKNYGRTYEGTFRHTFIVDETGIVRKIFKKVKTAEHGEEILTALDDLGM